jgi:ankyrin repeat protein
MRGHDSSAEKPPGRLALLGAVRNFALGISSESMAGQEKLRAQLMDLIERGADPDERDEQGATALMWAASAGLALAVEALLPVADASLLDSEGCAAIWDAANGGRSRVVELLLSKDVSGALMASKNGRTPLMAAAARGERGCVDALLPWSARWATCSRGLTAADYARKVSPELGSRIESWWKAEDEKDALAEESASTMVNARMPCKSL